MKYRANLIKSNGIKKRLKNYFKDPLYTDLRDLLRVEVNPREIVNYGVSLESSPLIKKNVFLPQAIKSIVNSKKPFIIPKDCTPKLYPYTNFKTFRFINDIWRNNLNYSETDAYKAMMEDINNGSVIKRKEKTIKSITDLNSYFIGYVNLLKSMKEHGYNKNLVQDDIKIWIGTNGELIKDGSGGRHRLAAAQVTGIKLIPVKINRVHQLWFESNLSSNKITSENLRMVIQNRFNLKSV